MMILGIRRRQLQLLKLKPLRKATHRFKVPLKGSLPQLTRGSTDRLREGTSTEALVRSRIMMVATGVIPITILPPKMLLSFRDH